MVLGGTRAAAMVRNKMTGGNYSIFRPARDNNINHVAAMGCADLTEEADVSLNRQNASDLMY